jgi:non-specific serine/threonine protein kinase/serine/threonine-protein kinase
VLRGLLAGISLKGDLHSIVNKAIEPETARRYGSAAQLAEDIQRYLDGMPVEARSQTLMYRTARFVRRNRLLAGAGALLIVVLAVGLAATLWQYRIASHERRQAQDRFNKLRKLANSVIHEFHDSIADLPGAIAARALMLTRALEYLDGLAAEAGDDPALRQELAEAYTRVGDVQGAAGRASLGKWAEAKRSYTKAIKLLDGVAGSEIALARALIRAGGEENAKRAVEIAAAAGRKSVLADAYFAQANEISQRGDIAGALAVREKDLQLRRELLAADPKNPAFRGNLALVQKRVGGLLIRLNRLDEAYDHYAAALEIERQWVAAAPLSVEARTAVSFSTSDIGFIRIQQRRFPEALVHYRETVALRQALFAADAKNYRTRTILASGCWRTADLLVTMGRVAESLPLLKRAEELLVNQAVTFAQREELANIRHSQGRAYGPKGKALLERALAEFLQLSREEPGRADLVERVQQIESRLRKGRFSPG